MPLQLILQLLDDQENAAEPRQMRLYRLLKSAILDGRLSPGTRLPGTRQLATDQRMARNCVLFAYQQLLAEGFLEADRGGTRVAALPLTREPAVPKSPRPAATTLSQRARHLPPAVRGESYLPFAPGVPDLNAFPWPAWSRVLQRAWSDVSARQVAYAEPGGEPELRRAVAAFLSARRGVACTAEQPDERRRGQADDGVQPGHPRELPPGAAVERRVVAQLRNRAVPMDRAASDAHDPHPGGWRRGRGRLRAVAGGRCQHRRGMAAPRQFRGQIGQQAARRRLGRRKKLVDQHDVHGRPESGLRRAASIMRS